MKHSGNAKRTIALLLRRCLERGASIEIDGLGTFLPGKDNRFRFVAKTAPRVFIAYVEEDLRYARRLYDDFSAAGFQPWLDKKKLVPGQNWPRAIETAIQSSDFFVACFSRQSVSKRGSFQSELRFAMECAGRVPLDEIFFIPVRIEQCNVPNRITRHLQYEDLFPDWSLGLERVTKTIMDQHTSRKGKELPLAG